MLHVCPQRCSVPWQVTPVVLGSLLTEAHLHARLAAVCGRADALTPTMRHAEVRWQRPAFSFATLQAKVSSAPTEL